MIATSTNFARRHLTAGQKAAIAADLLPQYEAEAKERQGERADIREKVPGSSDGKERK